jgi:glycosyltransferase involved in cell wall biosynthesis
LVGLRTRLRQMLGVLTLPAAGRQLRAVVQQVQPDLVHAMRIPFEGMLAASAGASPLLVSVWGNDFTLHAASNPWMAAWTRRTLHACTALHADCRRDIRLAHTWGLPDGRPTRVLPGGGGLQLDLFYPPQRPVAAPVIIQPRGFRAYVDNQAFFHALPDVLKARPEARVLCPGMAGEAQVQTWVQELGLSQAVALLPPVPRSHMADLFRSARVVVSPTHHDGTPNSLLEAMACGCLPVAGDLESIREWITPGENGLLVNLKSPGRLAEAIVQALSDDGLQMQAAAMNARLVAERASYPQVMAQAQAFYHLVTA